MANAIKKGTQRLAPEVTRILFVKNLPFKISSEELHEIFGKYGALRQVRLGTSPSTKGTAFVIYHDIYDAKNALDHLNGFNVASRYLIVLYYQPNKTTNIKAENANKAAQLNNLKEKFNIQ